MSSRPFNARMTAGKCYFCERAVSLDDRIQRGESVLYLTAYAVGDRPGRPLTTKELKIWRALGRDRKWARKRKQPVPSGPEWLWDRMVHTACAESHGFPIPAGTAAPRVGTRILGHADGTATKIAQAGFVGETAGQKKARAAMAIREAAAMRARSERETARRLLREEGARKALEARRVADAAFAAQREVDRLAREERQAKAKRDAEIVTAANGDASVERFLRLDLDDESAPADPDAYDASVERFKLLDLD